MKDKTGKDIYISRIYILEEILGEYLNIDIGQIPNSALKIETDKAIITKEREVVRCGIIIKIIS
jgi:hypothetical protein